ncbi:MAG: threonine--tRNA ligase [Candidatus Omnitrophota bacterium]
MDLEILRHSTSHIMAHAVKELYPEVKLGIGPAIAEGFYYDFDLAEHLSPEDLLKIEERMREIITQKLKFEKKVLSKTEAVEFFKQQNEDYKIELINEIPEEEVSVYINANFTDLCRGPHLDNTGEVKAFKLLSVAGAYWRGSEKNKMLQRIYGTAFFTAQELDNYLQIQEEIKKRDHRKLGRELDLFSIQEDAGAGLIFWHPKGAIVRNIIEDFWKEEHLKNGYEIVYIPHIANMNLWKTSGHLDFYAENMYSPIDIETQKYILKPMNCPGHILIYKSKTRSYRDLPIRWAELGTVYRYEKSGVLHGLMRVRGFTQDDAHIFCSAEQFEDEVTKAVEFAISMLKTFGFAEYEIYHSTMPEKHVGDLEYWQLAEKAINGALKRVTGGNFKVDDGEGVFYGPKIDIKIKDVLGRAWQCTTVQIDFNLPARFNISYVDKDGKEKTPIMIHRALLGSLERFFGILIEHYAGAFPHWLSPVQVMIIPITDKHHHYAKEIADKLTSGNIRVSVDLRREKINYKIREASLQKIPDLIIVGDKEIEDKTISVRSERGKDKGKTKSGIKIDDFILQLEKIIAERK